MPITSELRKTIKKTAFGKTLLPQEFTLGLPEPQTEITVWLHGAGPPFDVTHRHSMVSASPLVICIGFDEWQRPDDKDMARLSLKFCERDGQNRVLGEIGLSLREIVPGVGSKFILFEPRSSKNFCLPKARLWTHYLLHAYRQWRSDNTNGIKMSFLERRAGMVVFICPHPIVLVSVGSRDDGNIFPMNLFGDLGDGYFGFALRTERLAGGLVERAGRAALSSLPLSQGHLAYRLAKNHTKQSIDWDQLPFATKMSPALKIPVPDFAQRVKEVEIETVRELGSHNFFVARIVHDEKFSDDLGFCSIHGFYQSWRLDKRKARNQELAVSLAGDALNKRGRYDSQAVQNAPIEIGSHQRQG
jgi:flavin reductase (DIM6/NTAB) family NADH-FMN oxidoreductase RutF